MLQIRHRIKTTPEGFLISGEKGTSSDLVHPSTTLKTRVLETVLQVEVKNSNMNVVRLYIQIHKHE